MLERMRLRENLLNAFGGPLKRYALRRLIGEARLLGQGVGAWWPVLNAAMRWELCPQDCPCQLQKTAVQSQQQPSRSIEEVIKTRGFARKNENGRQADRRLANRRFRPLSHLTARLQVYAAQALTQK